ncbi:MAG: hypothetical protein D6681_14985 [Calditrichaeota bacterium]|nr:MAG: hypothetical protein D6681_14985 [Calditrichota bacterium]
MKKRFVLATVMVLSLMALAQELRLANSLWVSGDPEDCVDSLMFGNEKEVVVYSCALEKKYLGTYEFQHDTLFVTADSVISDVEDEFSESIRLGFIVIDGKLKMVTRQTSASEDEWDEPETDLEDEYIFTRVKR